MIICPNLSNKEVAQEFNELKSALEAADPKHGEAMAYLVWSLNNGNAIDKAPNGAESLLFKSLVDYYEGNRSKAIVAKAKTYSTSFLKWFGNWGGFKTIDTKNNLFTHTGKVNWDYFELLLNLYHNNQPDSMFSHGRYTLATRPENHFTGEKNTLNHIKFVTQSMLNLLEGKYDTDLPFVSEARASLQNQKDLMVIAAMFHDAAKPYRHGDIHGWESADILRDLLGIDYDNRVAEWAVRHHMPMPFSHKAEFNLSNPEAIEVAKNIARDAKRIGIDANTAINAFVLINAADIINGRELNVDDNWAKKAGEEGLKKYGGDISVKNVLSIELKEKVALLKKAFDEIKDEDFGDTAYNYSHQERFNYQAFPEGGREDKKLPYLNNTEYTGVSKVVDKNGEPLVVWHGSRISNSIEEFQNDNTFFADRYTAFSYTPFDAEDEREYMYPSFLSIKNPKIIDANGNFWNNIEGESTDDIAKSLSGNDGAIISNLKDYSDFTPGNPELSVELLNEAPLHTDYITSSSDQIKHIDNRDGEYTGPNIYHNLKDEDGNYEYEVPYDEVFSPYPEYDEETKKMFQRLDILQKEFNDLKNKRLELNKKLQEAKCDTISKKIVTLGDGRIKFVEKPNHLLHIDNDQRIFTLVSASMLLDGNVVTFPLLFPSKNVINPSYNYYRTDNSIRDNTNRLVYEMLSVLKNHGHSIIYSPWQVVTSGLYSEPDNAGKLKERMSKVLGIKLSDFVTHEETVVEDDQLNGKVRYYRIVFNIDTMLNRLNILGHNKEIYDIINKTYEQKPVSKNNDLLIKALLSEERDIDERQSQIQKEMRDINENLYKKEQENSDLPFNITQGSLIWLVKKYINEGRSRLDLLYILDEINYTNGSKIKINWSNFDVYAEPLSGKDDIKRTVDNNIERINAIVKYLNEKFGNKLQVEYINEDVWLRDSRLYNGSNSCIIGDVIYLRKSRMTTEIAAEEMLHTFVHGMKCGSNELGNKELFDNLFEKAKQLFPKLWNEILSVYKYNHDEELVTQVLARYFNRDFDKRDSYKLEDLINKFKSWFIKLFKTIIEEFAGNYYATVGDINPILNFQDISDMLLAKNLKFDIQTIPEIHKESLNNKVGTVYTEEQILHSISSRQQAAQDESQRLIIRMNVLYNQYEKMKDKTSSQQKIADRIFLTLNKLKLHRDIAAVGIALEQAKLSLGQYDPTIKGPATMETANIYDFLYNAEQTNFDGVQAQLLVDMYRNTIKFYSDLIAGIPSEQTIDLTQSDIDNIAQIKSLIEDHIMPLWIKAIMKVGDDIVDAQIDEEVESSYENREDMKKVAKDWLHKNMMYGDVNAVTSYLYNYSYSSNPIIKQAFHLIQHAEQLTLEEMHHIAPVLMKAYQKANKAANSVTPGWQSIMMEFDDKGVPTGNFIRDLNYGLYQKDLNEFIENLNKRFIDHYGFTYVIDDTGSVVNSLTNEFADDEEWVNGVMPTYVEYQREIEKFKSDRAHRRFTGDYYLERLSKPYDGNIDPMSPEFTDTRFDHGLSPKTLKRYNYYQSNINYYLNKCQDPKTGYVYPERLEDADKDQLDMWMAKMDKFTNVFEADGSYKMGEDLKMAYEVRAWQRWIGSKTNRIRYLDIFNTALKEAHQRSIAEGDPKIYKDFLRFNASTGINPDFIAQTVGSLNSGKPDTDLSLRGKIMRSSLQDQVKMQLSYGRRLWEKRNDPLFWLRCKEADQYVEDAAYPRTKGNWDEDTYKKFKENFYNRELLYVDARGNYVDENGNAVSVTDPNAKALEEAGKLLTIRDWLINEYTNEAFTSGQVLGLIDESTGNPIDFSGMTVENIRKVISEMLSYRKHKEEDDGSITEYNEPLSIFSMLTPNTDTFFNNRTGKTENTIVFLGERRFLETSSVYTNPMFNPNEGIAEKPNGSYDGGRYDNSQKYSEMRKDKDIADLYDLLIQTMSDSQSIYTTNRKFNYKLPQINAHTAALFSRILKRGYSTKALLSIWNSMYTIEENDNDMRTKQDYFIGVDGEMANDVPLKFIRNIKDPELLSTDLVSSVILFADMAHNYKNKTAIDHTLKLLRYNMDPENRKTYNKKLKPKSEPVSEDEHNKNSIKMYDSMMDILMYGNKYGDREKGGPSKMTVSVQKTADWFLSLESSAMLGLNMFSMSVGFADSITRIFSESAAGKYMTIGDCLYALGICLWYTPKCIWNMFNPLANNKLTALMLMNGISKGTYGTYVKADWGKGRKFISNLLMGGWSMLDWMANALLMTAFYHNIRFYDGGVVETGFYSKYDLQQAFMRAGHSKHEATLAHANYGNIGRRITLWDAYDFAPTIIENGKKVKLHGQVVIKPGYEKYITLKLKTRIATKTKKRGGLYNGMNPDNDVPRWKRDVIGRLAGALRGWIVLQFQHLVSGGTDNIAREFYNEVKYETTTSGTKAKTRQKKRAFTDELRSRRMAWDYETGTPLDQILIGLWRSFRSIYKVAVQTLASKPKTAKLSEVEKYAWKDSIIFLAMLAMMMVGWTYIHDDARTVLAPQNREQAGPASMLNPFDYYDYIQDVYIPNQYWKLGVDDIYFRTVEAKISNVNPQLVLDIVSALTALKSGLDDQLGIIGIGADLINGEDNDEVLKQGAYKFYTKGDRTLYRAVGPAKNLHTALTYYGATNNLRWYTNKFGKLYRAFGYDFKQKDKDAQSKAKSNFSGGNFSGGNFSGGGFSGGNFAGGNFQ